MLEDCDKKITYKNKAVQLEQRGFAPKKKK